MRVLHGPRLHLLLQPQLRLLHMPRQHIEQPPRRRGAQNLLFIDVLPHRLLNVNLWFIDFPCAICFCNSPHHTGIEYVSYTCPYFLTYTVADYIFYSIPGYVSYTCLDCFSCTCLEYISNTCPGNISRSFRADKVRTACNLSIYRAPPIGMQPVVY